MVINMVFNIFHPGNKNPELSGRLRSRQIMHLRGGAAGGGDQKVVVGFGFTDIHDKLLVGFLKYQFGRLIAAQHHPVNPPGPERLIAQGIKQGFAVVGPGKALNLADVQRQIHSGFQVFDPKCEIGK